MLTGCSPSSEQFTAIGLNPRQDRVRRYPQLSCNRLFRSPAIEELERSADEIGGVSHSANRTEQVFACPGRESNPHAFRQWDLNPSRMPVSPPGLVPDSRTAASLESMGRRKRRKEAKALAAAEGRPRRKRRRFRRLVVLGGLAGGIAAWRQRQLAENESKFGAAS